MSLVFSDFNETEEQTPCELNAQSSHQPRIYIVDTSHANHTISNFVIKKLSVDVSMDSTDVYRLLKA